MRSIVNGKIAVITGASRGLGKRAAFQLAKKGAHVVLISRNESTLEAVAGELRKSGAEATALALDLGAQASHEIIKERVLQVAGPPALLVNAAGVFGPISFIKDIDSAQWIETLMINTVGHFLTCRAFVGDMIDAGWGRIINVSSAAALGRPGPINSAYATSKAALNQFTRHLAAELNGTGVTANVIHPGDVKTEMWSTIRTSIMDLGPEADGFRSWADMVEKTGGDDPQKAADLILSIAEATDCRNNGRFLWIENGIKPPISSWQD